MDTEDRYRGMKKVTFAEYRREGVALLEGTERNAMVVCSDAGVPRMIVSRPDVSDLVEPDEDE